MDNHDNIIINNNLLDQLNKLTLSNNTNSLDLTIHKSFNELQLDPLNKVHLEDYKVGYVDDQGHI